VKRELLRKAKLSVFKTVFDSSLTYGYESWAMTERIRMQVQVSDMRFLRRIERVLRYLTKCVDLISKISEYQAATSPIRKISA